MIFLLFISCEFKELLVPPANVYHQLTSFGERHKIILARLWEIFHHFHNFFAFNAVES